MPTAEYYDAISPRYNSGRTASRVLVQRIVDDAGLRGQTAVRVLELGCGTGNYTHLMSDLIEGEVYGIDESDGMLSIARQGGGKARFVPCCATKIAAAGIGRFDVIYMIDVLHHIRDVNKLLGQAFACLAEGGMMFIFSDGPRDIEERLSTRFFPETLEVELRRYPRIETMVAQMEKVGFQGVEVRKVKMTDALLTGAELEHIARERLYSMFRFIDKKAIDAGLERLSQAIAAGPVIGCKNATYLVGSFHSG